MMRNAIARCQLSNAQPVPEQRQPPSANSPRFIAEHNVTCCGISWLRLFPAPCATPASLAGSLRNGKNLDSVSSF